MLSQIKDDKAKESGYIRLKAVRVQFTFAIPEDIMFQYKNSDFLTALYSLYEKTGYKKYKMSKFEEYSLYLDNKSFLSDGAIITFNDPDGKLLALKPDVTLSIAKNTSAGGKRSEKLYYTENVYRISDSSRQHKEIMQMGLEYIGEVDLYVLCEVIFLACMSLSEISESYTLDISHMGFVTGLLEGAGINEEKRRRILEAVSRKSSHEIEHICKKSGADAEYTEKIKSLCTLYGSFDTVLKKAKALVVNDKTADSLSELESIYNALSAFDNKFNLNLDFSVVNDMSYYNGIIFRGYIEGAASSVLSGGRYDNLMLRLGNNTGAIGFAINLDTVSMYAENDEEYDTDVLLLYSDSDSPAEVLSWVNSLVQSGTAVRAAKQNDGHIRCREVIEFEKRKNNG